MLKNEYLVSKIIIDTASAAFHPSIQERTTQSLPKAGRLVLSGELAVPLNGVGANLGLWSGTDLAGGKDRR